MLVKIFSPSLCCCSFFKRSFFTIALSLTEIHLQLEFLGPGVSSSINIDSRLSRKENGIGFSIGLGLTPIKGLLKDACNTGTLNSFPVGINYLIGKGKNLLELEGGMRIIIYQRNKALLPGYGEKFF